MGCLSASHPEVAMSLPFRPEENSFGPRTKVISGLVVIPDLLSIRVVCSSEARVWIKPALREPGIASAQRD
jgi:hypothetical protein